MGDPIGVCVDDAFIEETYRKLTAERDQHIPKLLAARQMWSDARGWIQRQAGLLLAQATHLTGADRWPDAAGRAFLQRALRDVAVMQSWVDRSGITSSLLATGIPATAPPGVPSSQVFDGLDALVAGIREAQAVVEGLRNRYRSMSEEDRAKHLDEIYGKVAEQLTGLRPKYEAASTALKHAPGPAWAGPRGGASSTSEPSSSPGPAAAAPGTAGPASPGPAPGTAQPPAQPSTQEAPATEDPLKAALAEAPNALDAASQALQGLQQLVGGGGDSPSPTDLGSLTPAEVAARLSTLADGSSAGSGLPSLAGGGGAPPGGGAGAAGFAAAAPMPSPAPDPVATAAAAVPAGSAFTTAGAAAASSAGPGMMPPAQPRGGGKAGSGVKPGDAEHAATGRSRKPGATPGVPLLGRAGRRGSKAGPPPAPRRRWDSENDTVQLLDEELWQVDKTDGAPRYRAGH
ncbi:hypothetical protein [Amycolatopsis sp. cg9]|uniref:hypothetical protein n=1 Tax=Amycolatopsis sp. cg9 TaxID=3238801 RepID=UPI003524098A